MRDGKSGQLWEKKSLEIFWDVCFLWDEYLAFCFALEFRCFREGKLVLNVMETGTGWIMMKMEDGWFGSLTHSGFYPHRLAASQSSHLVDIGEVELPLVGPIFRSKSVLFPRLAQQALYRDLSLDQAVRPRPLVAMLLVDPPAVDEDRRAVLALQRRDDHVAVLAVAHAGADEHLLVVSQRAGGEDAAEVELADYGRVDVWRQGEGIADETVFRFGDEAGFPAEALDLPCAEDEGGDGHEGCLFGTRDVSLANVLLLIYTFIHTYTSTYTCASKASGGGRIGLLRTEKNDSGAMTLPCAHRLRLQIDNRYEIGVIGRRHLVGSRDSRGDVSAVDCSGH